MIDIREFGAEPGSAKDIGEAFRKAFAAGERSIFVPAGEYVIDTPIELPSHTEIQLDEAAVIKAAPGKNPARKMHLVGNDDVENGNCDITISGGLWDGNCAENARLSYDDEEFVGLMFDFCNVDGLKLHDVRMKNASCYHVRLGEVRNFEIARIRIEGELTPLCQDGIHMGGFCASGHISDVYAAPGSLGDDLIALNADDVFTYSNNWGMKQGPIRNIHVERVEAPNCFTGVRLLSIETEISDCSFTDVRMGVREHGLNMDATRYCEDPLFAPDAYPQGVGNIRNVTFKNLELWKTGGNRELFTWESNCENMVIENFIRRTDLEPENDKPTLQLRHLGDTVIEMDGAKKILKAEEEFVTDSVRIGRLTVNRIRN